AFSQLTKDKDDLKLIFAGDGPLRADIEEEVRQNDLSQSVILLGTINREEVYNFLNCCDLFVMPSLSEGLNVSFLEAFSQGASILVSDIEQFSYPLKHYNINPQEHNILFVNPNNVESIKEGLQKSLSLKKSKSIPDDSFSIERMMDQYFNIYKELKA